MKYINFFALIITLLHLQACKNGSETLPELAGKIFASLQKNSADKLLNAAPTLSGYEDFYKLYYSDKYADKTELQKQATDKAASMRLTLSAAFNQVMAEAKDKKIDWAITKILDMKYTIKDNKNGYQDAKVRMILESGIDKNVILFDAIQVDKRWYLIENFRWEE